MMREDGKMSLDNFETPILRPLIWVGDTLRAGLPPGGSTKMTSAPLGQNIQTRDFPDIYSLAFDLSRC